MALTLKQLSRKQRMLLNWWHPSSPVSGHNGIIADGSIRAGKTTPMSISFIEWAFASFPGGYAFGLAGKTIGSFSRNVLFWLKPFLEARGYVIKHKRMSDEGNYLEITRQGKTQRFYIFGGRDESSQNLVQGVTLAGFYFDEVVLMPESFVNQATGRCSVEGAKFWFNCNPDAPGHWFKEQWLDRSSALKLLHLHFEMDDNPSLSEEIKQRYRSLYTGVFFKRFILGLWVQAEGAIYDMFDDENVFTEMPVPPGRLEQATRDIAIDYGTSNPMVFLDVRDTGDQVLIVDEYYYDGRKESRQKTDYEYANDCDAFTGGPEKIRYAVIDPSAASFRAELRNRGYRIKEADNSVLDGIRLTSSLIGKRVLTVSATCKNFIKEIGGYSWDDRTLGKGKEQPLKIADHAMDAMRYWVKTIYNPRRLMLD